MEDSRESQLRYPVLFVDDDPIMHRLIDVLLKDWEVFHADSAEKALEILQEESIMIVLSDIAMPGMDGIELMRKIKQIYGAIQVILITSKFETEYLVNALESGANDFILKPVSRETLFSSLDNTAAKIHRWKSAMKLLFEKRRKRKEETPEA